MTNINIDMILAIMFVTSFVLFGFYIAYRAVTCD